MEVPRLLTMDNTQLRAILQRAIRIEIFDSPNEPSFTQISAETSNAHEDSAMTLLPEDARPTWIPVLEQHFRRGHQREPPDYNPTLQVQVWFLNDDMDYHCTRARLATIADESFMWRTDLIFQWRDRIMRASPIDVVALPSLIASNPHDMPMPHVIVTQGLQSNTFAVLITVRGTGPLQMLARQFAHVFHGRVLGREVIRLAVPEEHRHRPVIIQMAGQTYFPDDVLFVQMGTHLSVLISADTVDIYSDPNGPRWARANIASKMAPTGPKGANIAASWANLAPRCAYYRLYDPLPSSGPYGLIDDHAPIWAMSIPDNIPKF